jgi:hypothetical protein
VHRPSSLAGWGVQDDLSGHVSTANEVLGVPRVQNPVGPLWPSAAPVCSIPHQPTPEGSRLARVNGFSFPQRSTGSNLEISGRLHRTDLAYWSLSLDSRKKSSITDQLTLWMGSVDHRPRECETASFGHFVAT